MACVEPLNTSSQPLVEAEILSDFVTYVDKALTVFYITIFSFGKLPPESVGLQIAVNVIPSPSNI